jgi:hypothetical protein
MSGEPIDIESARARRATGVPSVEEQAEAYKIRTIKILGDLVELMREAEREDFRIEFEIGRDSLEWPLFVGPTIVKRFP